MRIRPTLNIILSAFIALLVLAIATNCGGDDGSGGDDGTPSPGTGEAPTVVDLSIPWQESSPAGVGVQDMTDVISNASDLSRLTSLLVVYDGTLIVEEYFDGFRADSLHDVRAVTKSIVAMLVGQAVLEGFIQSAEDPIYLYLQPEFSLTAEQQEIRIRHLLQMSGGFDWNESNGPEYDDWINSNDQVEYLLNRALINQPGEAFTYNSASTHLLGVVLSKAYGQPLSQLVDDQIFSQIGISRADWEPLSGGYFNGGSGIDLRARDMARIGQLMLQNGQSGSRQVVERTWLEFLKLPAYGWRSVYGAVSNYTYGGQWWINDVEETGGYFAWGMGGQFIYVVPEKNLVVVTTSNFININEAGGVTAVTQEILDLIVNQIVPKVP